MARILITDHETSPILAESWGPMWKTNLIRVVRPTHLLTTSWKWLGEDEVHSMALPDWKRTFSRNQHDDSKLAEAIGNLYAEADIVVAHNGIKFDTPTLNARLAAAGLDAPEPFKQVDTLQAARRAWRLPSYKLDEIALYLGLKRKVATGGIGLWHGVGENDPDAWARMRLYNEGDVETLEELYLFQRDHGWLPNHPSVVVDDGHGDRCRVCGSTDLMRRGYHTTNTHRYVRYQCKQCKHYSRSRFSEPAPKTRLV